MTIINKEELRKQILEDNGFNIQNYDYSIFGDDDPDVFAKLVGFDMYKKNVYPTLSEKLRNNKEVVVSAAKCQFNIEFIPDHFFQDKDVIKVIIYDRSEKNIPLHHLNKEIINYMFVTCARSSLATEDIKKACDEHLTKESIISVLLTQNNFHSDCKKKKSLPCIDDIYIPEKFLQDKDILQLLIIPQFKLIKDNDNITKEMIIELLDSGYILSNLPKKFFNDNEFIKQCLKYEHNYHFFENYEMTELLQENRQLNKECVTINSNIANYFRYPLLFENFKDLFSKDISKIDCASKVIPEEQEQLFDYLTSEEILKLFINKDTNFSQKYNFSVLYKIRNYYKNPIVNNKFIIEEMAKQDKYLFPYLSETVAQDNKFMYKLIFDYKAQVNFKDEPIEALYPQINHFGSFKKYVNMLKLEHDLSFKLTPLIPGKTRKI